MTRYAETFEEGERCPMDGCTGQLMFRAGDNCSCHISPPCGSCVDAPLTCHFCGWEVEDLGDETTEETCPAHRQPISRCPRACDRGEAV